MAHHIVALGGGGFSEEPDNPLLDHYILKLTGKASPAICFLGQASGESQEYTLRFYQAFTRLGARPTHLSLFACPVGEIEAVLLAQDVTASGVTFADPTIWCK